MLCEWTLYTIGMLTPHFFPLSTTIHIWYLCCILWNRKLKSQFSQLLFCSIGPQQQQKTIHVWSIFRWKRKQTLWISMKRKLRRTINISTNFDLTSWQSLNRPFLFSLLSLSLSLQDIWDLKSTHAMKYATIVEALYVAQKVLLIDIWLPNQQFLSTFEYTHLSLNILPKLKISSYAIQ